MNTVLTLTAGSSEATLLPRLGGSIGTFRVGPRAILRPTPTDATSPLDAASFPLVPYANRIAGGRFAFAGRQHTLPPNAAGFVHPLHGLGWLKPWAVAACSASAATMICVHDEDADWPWAWAATQTVSLGEGRLQVVLEVTNLSDRAMPCGIGQHPYFVRESDVPLTFAAAGVWLNDEAMIPVREGAAGCFGDFASGAVPGSDPAGLVDNCWFGWGGTAQWGEGVRLTSPQSRFLHVFAPPGEDFVCLEPTTQMPDALNRPDFAAAGGVSLAPGASQRLDMVIEAA